MSPQRRNPGQGSPPLSLRLLSCPSSDTPLSASVPFLQQLLGPLPPLCAPPTPHGVGATRSCRPPTTRGLPSGVKGTPPRQHAHAGRGLRWLPRSPRLSSPVSTSAPLCPFLTYLCHGDGVPLCPPLSSEIPSEDPAPSHTGTRSDRAASGLCCSAPRAWASPCAHCLTPHGVPRPPARRMTDRKPACEPEAGGLGRGQG